MPYFAIGILLKQKWETIVSYNQIRRKAVFATIFFYATTLVEKTLLEHINMNATRDHYISTTFLAIAVFLLFVVKEKNKPNWLTRIGEEDSLYLYILHPLLIMFFSIVIPKMPAFAGETYDLCAPIVVFISTLILVHTMRVCGILKNSRK